MKNQTKTQVVAIFLSILLLLGIFQMSAFAIEMQDTSAIFVDVCVGDWYKEAVDYVYTKNLMVGMSEDMFGPDTDMSRAMFVTVLYRMENEPAVLVATTPFTDVEQDWYKDPIAWAYENELVAGIDDTLFAPESPLTRDQLVTLLYRYAKYKGYVKEQESIIDKEDNLASWSTLWNDIFVDDNDIQPWAAQAVAWAYSEEIVGGIQVGENEYAFKPYNNATRAQVAQILKEFLKKY